MKKLIIFDLDGTLINTLEDLANAVNFSLDSFGYPRRSLEQVRKDIGNGVAKLVERSIPGGISNQNYAKCLDLFKKHYKENYNKSTTPYFGMDTLLALLKNEGYLLTVATNKIIDIAKSLLEEFFPGVFTYIEGDREGMKKKPNPDMIDSLINHFNVKKNEVIYVGDTNVDEETSLNSKIDYILVTFGYRTKEEIKKSCQCTNLVDDPKQLFKAIKQFI